MTNATAQPPVTTRGGGMTMRVYTVDRYGTTTQDRGAVNVIADNHLPPVRLGTAYPPCQCPRHAGQAATR